MADSQAIVRLGQAGRKAAILLEEGHTRLGQHAVERALDTLGEQVQTLRRGRAHLDVERDAEHLLVTALQSIAQPLRILVGGLPFRIGQATVAVRQQPRGVQRRQLVRQRRDHRRALQPVEVQAHLQRLGEPQEGVQPARADGARIPGDGEDSHVLLFQAEVIARHLHGGGRDEVGEGACAGAASLIPAGRYGSNSETARPGKGQRESGQAGH